MSQDGTDDKIVKCEIPFPVAVRVASISWISIASLIVPFLFLLAYQLAVAAVAAVAAGFASGCAIFIVILMLGACFLIVGFMAESASVATGSASDTRSVALHSIVLGLVLWVGGYFLVRGGGLVMGIAAMLSGCVLITGGILAYSNGVKYDLWYQNRPKKTAMSKESREQAS